MVQGEMPPDRVAARLKDYFNRLLAAKVNMIETWLEPNSRILRACLVIAALVVAIGLILLSLAEWYGLRPWVTVLSGVIVTFGLLHFIVVFLHMRKPHIGYRNGYILFYLQFGSPIAVPLEVVEAFFLGQGDSHLSGKAGQAKTINLVARIGERFAEWQRIDVIPQLGNWCDGYVIIRGTWTEPLNEEVVRAINHKLAEAKRSVAGR